MGGGQTVCVFYCFLNFHAGGVIKIGNIFTCAFKSNFSDTFKSSILLGFYIGLKCYFGYISYDD